jgi:putative hydrolase of the HAD superfamily
LIKAVIFDFDGLIIDTETAWYDAYRETLSLYKLELPLELYVKTIGSDDTVLFEYLKEQLGESCNLEEIEAKAKNIHQVKMKTPQACKGVKEYLEEAKKLRYKIALASSSTKEWVTDYLNKLGLLHYFDLIISRDDVDKIKPAPDLYLKAIEVLNINSTDAVAFEDSLNGLQAALSAGLKCVIVPNPVTEDLAFKNHHLRIKSMAEKTLTDVIKLIEQK